MFKLSSDVLLLWLALAIQDHGSSLVKSSELLVAMLDRSLASTTNVLEPLGNEANFHLVIRVGYRASP